MARDRAELPGDMVPGRCVWRGGGGEGGRRGEEGGGCPSPRRGSRASSVLLFHSVGGRREGRKRSPGPLVFLHSSGHFRAGEADTCDQSSPIEGRGPAEGDAVGLASLPQNSPALEWL